MALPEEIVATPEQLTECCHSLGGTDVFGFDTEFVGEDTYHPHLCLVQVATEERLYLIDAQTVGAMDAFWGLVNDPNRTVIVHAGREEIRLCHLWSGDPPGCLFDVQIAAGLLGLGWPLGYGPLLQATLGVKLAKGEQLTDWRKRPLSEAQIRYAFDDVRYLIPLYRKMSERLRELKRLTWADEEFESLKRKALKDREEVEPWRKLRGLGGLSRRGLAAARELYLWRERRAYEMNRSPSSIVRTDLISEIAKRMPLRERDLRALRGLHREEYHHEIIAAVERARAMPEADLPRSAERENDSPQVGQLTSLLSAVLAGWCAEYDLIPGIVCTQQDLKWLVRAEMTGEELSERSALAHGWRREFVLPELRELLRGRRLVRVADLNAENPLRVVDPTAGPGGEPRPQT